VQQLPGHTQFSPVYILLAGDFGSKNKATFYLVSNAVVFKPALSIGVLIWVNPKLLQHQVVGEDTDHGWKK